MRIALVVIVKDSYEYIPAFTAYHKKLFDMIYFVDHNSTKDLRALNGESIRVLRARQASFFQAEFTNIVIDHFHLVDNYDWLFVLDADEFLPFCDRAQFVEFLSRYSHSRVIRLRWRNGAPIDHHQELNDLSEARTIQFYRRWSMTAKAAVNIRRTGTNFYMRRSNHNIGVRRPPLYTHLPGLRRLQTVRPDTVKSLPIYHIPSISPLHFGEKIDNFKSVLHLQRDVKRLGGRLIESYASDVSRSEWLWYVANYRVRDKSRHFDVDRADFENVDLFANLDRGLVDLVKNQLREAAPAERGMVPGPLEEAYISVKAQDNHLPRNLRWFAVEGDEIVLVIPSATAGGPSRFLAPSLLKRWLCKKRREEWSPRSTSAG